MLKKILPIICFLFLCGCRQQILNEKYDNHFSYIEEKNYQIVYKDIIRRFDLGEFEKMPTDSVMKMVDYRLFEDIKTAYIKYNKISLIRNKESWSYLLEFKAINETQTEVKLYY